METTLILPVKKKRGPAKRLPDMVGTKIYLEAEVLDWAKCQPDGLASLVRRLLDAEKARQERRRS
jgi:hypothetical protein